MPPTARKASVVSLTNSICNPDSRIMRHTSALARAGHTVTVICKLADGLLPEEEVDGVRYVRVPMRARLLKPRSGPMMFRAFASFVERPAQALKPDIVDAHDLIALPAAIRIARETGAKVLYDVHDLYLHQPKRRSRFAYWFGERTEKRNIKLADAVITVSDGMADYLRSSYGIPRPILVMNAPEVKPADGGSQRNLRSELGLGPDVPLGVYTGGRNRSRGLDKLVQALGQVPALHLALVGHRQGGDDTQLRRIAEAGSWDHRLHIVPPVHHDRVVNYVASADFAILPYHVDCLNHEVTIPTKLFEAVFAGLPVVVHKNRALREFVEATGTGLVTDSRDVESMANTLRHMVRDQDQLHLSDEKVSSLIREYGWPTQAKRLLEVYDRLIEG